MPLITVEPPPITVEQYERFTGYPGLRDELIQGEIVLSPQPKPLHQQVAQNIHDLLRTALRSQPYTARKNSNLRFPGVHSMPAPDVFVVSREEWRRACRENDYVSQAPALVVEVLSPANRKKRVQSKVEVYLSAGVPAVWLVYPKKQQVEVITSAGAATANGPLQLPDPLPGSVDTWAFFQAEELNP